MGAAIGTVSRAVSNPARRAETFRDMLGQLEARRAAGGGPADEDPAGGISYDEACRYISHLETPLVCALGPDDVARCVRVSSYLGHLAAYQALARNYRPRADAAAVAERIIDVLEAGGLARAEGAVYVLSAVGHLTRNTFGEDFCAIFSRGDPDLALARWAEAVAAVPARRRAVPRLLPRLFGGGCGAIGGLEPLLPLLLRLYDEAGVNRRRTARTLLVVLARCGVREWPGGDLRAGLEALCQSLWRPRSR